MGNRKLLVKRKKLDLRGKCCIAIQTGKSCVCQTNEEKPGLLHKREKNGIATPIGQTSRGNPGLSDKLVRQTEETPDCQTN